PHPAGGRDAPRRLQEVRLRQGSLRLRARRLHAHQARDGEPRQLRARDPMTSAPRIALAPEPGPVWLRDAIEAGGGHVVPLAECEAIIWADAHDPDRLVGALAAAPTAKWVQLPFAGIENFLPHLDHDRRWTCGKGVYAGPVAELALALGLAGLRGLGTYARAASWSGPRGHGLVGGNVTIVGGGGIGEALIELLQSFDCHITVVRRNVDHMDGVD